MIINLPYQFLESTVDIYAVQMKIIIDEQHRLKHDCLTFSFVLNIYKESDVLKIPSQLFGQ